MKLLNTIILTNPSESIDRLAKPLRGFGKNVICLPLIKIIPSEINADDIPDLSQFQWLLITSKNAFQFFMTAIQQTGHKLNSNIKIGCIGEKTADFIQKSGYKADFVSDGNTGLEFLTQFCEIVDRKQRILFPHGNLFDSDKLTELKKSADVFPIEVYQTIAIESKDSKISDIIQHTEYDFVVFTSPSAVDSFVSQFKITDIKAVSIGSSTTLKMSEYGIIPVLQPQHSNYNGIIDEILNYYKKAETNYAIS